MLEYIATLLAERTADRLSPQAVVWIFFGVIALVVAIGLGAFALVVALN